MALSANEQLLLELINRARLDPLAEAQRYGIDLNEDLNPGTLDGSAKQVLAANDLLNVAAQGHAQWMLNTDNFNHTGQGGSSPGDRMADAGYSFTGSWTWGENISWRGTTGTPDLEGWIYLHHEGLFKSSGHRENILNGTFREIGLSQEEGVFTTNRDYNASMVVEKFAKSGSAYFLTGVVYNDGDANAFYTPGEGVGSRAVAITGGGSTSTEGAGGYAIATGSGTHTVTFGSGAGAVSVDVVLSSANAKLDLVDGAHVLSSASIELLSGASAVTLLGVADLDAAGTASSETLLGNSGANELRGGGGNDSLGGGLGHDRLDGGSGADILDGGSGFDIAGYLGSGAGVTVSLSTGSGSGGDAEGDQLTGIEHVQGSNFDDVITGDAGKNFLYGQDGNDQLLGLAGDDKLFGGGGHDHLYGGSGAELLDGGSGFDLARYLTSSAGVTVDLTAGTGSGGDAEGDQLVNIEHVQGSDFGDVLTGDAGKNFLYGQDGNDQLFGLAGDDKLFGGGGHDHLYGGSGAELLDGGSGFDLARYLTSSAGVTVDLTAGTGSGGDAEGDQLVRIEHVQGSDFADVLTGDAGKNFLYGQDGNDQLFGLAGDDRLFGGGGHDHLYGGSGAELLDGGSGFDLARYLTSSAGVAVDLTAGTGSGGDAEGDQLVNIEHVQGSNFDDVLTGDAGKNFLYGLGGDDTFFGLGGDDRFFGGSGSDTFVFASGGDADTVHDFTVGAGSDDILDISYFAFATLDDVLNSASQAGGDVVITLDGTSSVTLLGTSLGALHEDDFLFV